MGQDAIPQIAGSNDPPVVNRARDQSNVPVGPMFGREQNSDDPEALRVVRSERDAFEISRDKPAHEPSSPEELFEYGNGYNAGQDAEEQKTGVRFFLCSHGTDRASQCAVRKKPVIPPGRKQNVGSDPDREYRKAQKDTPDGIHEAEAKHAAGKNQ